MERVGEHPVPAGPLAVRWLAHDLPALRAGVASAARVALQNAGTATWRSRGASGVQLSYHWLDDARQPDRLGRPARRASRGRSPRERRSSWRRSSARRSHRALPARVRPRRGVALLVRGGRLVAARARRRRGAADRASGVWLSLSTAATTRDTSAALAAQEEPVVDDGRRRGRAPRRRERVPEPDWSRRVLDAHAEGFAAVGGSIETRDRRSSRGRPAAAATRASRTRCCCRRSSTGSSRASTRASRPTSQPNDETAIFDGRIRLRLPRGRRRG